LNTRSFGLTFVRTEQMNKEYCQLLRAFTASLLHMVRPFIVVPFDSNELKMILCLQERQIGGSPQTDLVTNCRYGSPKRDFACTQFRKPVFPTYC
jgi:hypothetical protein